MMESRPLYISPVNGPFIIRRLEGLLQNGFEITYRGNEVAKEYLAEVGKPIQVIKEKDGRFALVISTKSEAVYNFHTNPQLGGALIWVDGKSIKINHVTAEYGVEGPTYSAVFSTIVPKLD